MLLFIFFLSEKKTSGRKEGEKEGEKEEKEGGEHAGRGEKYEVTVSAKKKVKRFVSASTGQWLESS